MTEAELWELNAIYIANGINATGMYLTVTFQDLLAPRAEAYGRELVANVSYWSGYMGILMVLGIVISLYFLYDVRKKAL